jgi:hypothetical protein
VNADRKALVEAISRAFAASDYPQGDPISESPNDEGTAEYFRGRSWRDCSTKDLMRHDFALLAFTPRAFAYFLPAFLVASLDHPKRAPIDHVILVLTPPKNDPRRPSFWRRWSLLTPAQRQVVVDCLRYWGRAEPGTLDVAATSLQATIDA